MDSIPVRAADAAIGTKSLSIITGMPTDAMRRMIARVPAALLPMSGAIIQDQQQIADRFRALGLLPADIAVANVVWHPNA